PLPARAQAPYLVRHGAGYSDFEHHSHGLKQRLRLFAARDDPVKLVQLRLENTLGSPRRITATYYVEWVLGVTREPTQQYVVPEFDNDSQALLARNAYHVEFGGRVAFAAGSKALHGLTADRTEFLGRMGSLESPSGLQRIGLSGKVEAGYDPCAALQLHLDLQPGETQEVHFLLGQGSDREDALRLVKKYQDRSQVEAAWEDLTGFWEGLLGAVQVRTPEPAMDLLLNRWLLYQTLAGRYWGRSGFYQSSGAFGFRDQLQDVLALAFAAPEFIREHLLRAARQQFEAGDVLHWWHPPTGRGVRTRISDDLLWLPYTAAHYVLATGDESLLAEEVSFLQGPPLEPGQAERYQQYQTSNEVSTLFEHCRRALDKATTSGPHGLPLIGAGDWNDGMNLVGREGRGESVWLGWFLYDNLVRFSGICERQGNEELARFYRERAEELDKALEEHAWDGEWYRRAYYDDGTPLGSAANRECRIDSIAQSWSVLSGAGDLQRSVTAMRSVLELLVRPEEQLVLLFTPPFNRTPRDPGYIKSYLPGIRENGGQYTHAALWVSWALAQLGDGDQAEGIFRLLNPIQRADTPESMRTYKVEPYVVAADIYSEPPYQGRGGWTWYTGSSGWMYRLGLEAILGLQLEGGSLKIDPCIPKDWPGYEITVRRTETAFHIRVENPSGINRGVREIWMDGKSLREGLIPLVEDGKEHEITVQLGA
ncbi:MAG TPA: protein ndvB, partial [Anaerolineales bacterium]|nr:protein ndvB [Anaerolineales bacterium]